MMNHKDDDGGGDAYPDDSLQSADAKTNRRAGKKDAAISELDSRNAKAIIDNPRKRSETPKEKLVLHSPNRMIDGQKDHDNFDPHQGETVTYGEKVWTPRATAHKWARKIGLGDLGVRETEKLGGKNYLVNNRQTVSSEEVATSLQQEQASYRRVLGDTRATIDAAYLAAREPIGVHYEYIKKLLKTKGAGDLSDDKHKTLLRWATIGANEGLKKRYPNYINVINELEQNIQPLALFRKTVDAAWNNDFQKTIDAAPNDNEKRRLEEKRQNLINDLRSNLPTQLETLHKTLCHLQLYNMPAGLRKPLIDSATNAQFMVKALTEALTDKKKETSPRALDDILAYASPGNFEKRENLRRAGFNPDTPPQAKH